MAYIPSECTIEQYRNAVYNAEAKHKCYLSFNGVEYQNVDDTLSKIVIKSNLINTTDKVFMLSNLISKSIEITIHDIDVSDIQDPIELKIGTYINETIGYVYVPIGIFNIQETPTTSNGITTIKARDNAVKLDVNYNAKPIIEANNGSVTKKQILDNICSLLNITNGVTSFRGQNELVGIYDNSIKARTYVSYFAEQAGCLVYIDRQGKLQFKKLSDLYTWNLPIDDVSKYTNDTTYKISKVIYESGDIKYENTTEQPTNDILYLNGANPYITSKTIVEEIYELVKDFTIQSFNVEKIYGNACIDQFDLISVKNYNNISYITLGQNTLTYNGKLMQTFDTQISKEKKNTNITINSEATYRKGVKSEIDNVKATFTRTVEDIDDLKEQYSKVLQTANNLELSFKDLNKKVDSNNTKVDTLGGTVTSMTFNFNTKGLAIGTENDENNSLLDNRGIRVYNYTKLSAIFNNKGSGIDKLIVTGTAQLGYLRFVKSTKDNGKVTKIFHLNKLIEDLHDLE